MTASARLLCRKGWAAQSERTWIRALVLDLRKGWAAQSGRMWIRALVLERMWIRALVLDLRKGLAAQSGECGLDHWCWTKKPNGRLIFMWTWHLSTRPHSSYITCISITRLCLVNRADCLPVRL